MSTKRRFYSSSRRFVARKYRCEPTDASTRASTTPPSFTKVLLSKNQLFAAHNQCALILPKKFCVKHKMKRNITVTDSTGQKMWPMRFQSLIATRFVYRITNGWRHFAYDHSLELSDRLVFTLVSPSHFVVEFEISEGSPCPMRPTSDGKDYPWGTKGSWKNCRSWRHSTTDVHSSRDRLQGTEEAGKAMAAAVSPIASKQAEQEEILFCQCNTLQHKFTELTHLECKNPDGTTYLQILDSASEVAGREGEEDEN